MNQSEPSRRGALEIPRGTLVLPQRLVCGNNEKISVAWSPWAKQDQLQTATGQCGSLRLSARCEMQDALHCQIEVLNLAAEPVELRELAWTLELDQPDRIHLLPECGIFTCQPWDFNLTHETLMNRYLSLTYKRKTLCIGSNDPLVFGNGFVRCEPLSMRDPRLRLAWHRIEPHWDYHGLISTRPLNGLWIYEGQTRAASLVIATSTEKRRKESFLPEANTTRCPLCVRSPRARAEKILEKIASFRIERGEYAGLFAGGYCHRNRRLLEPHVNRAEYGEFLLHEYLRSGDPLLWEWTAAFAERFQQVAVNRSNHPARGGAVRGRYGDHVTAHPIRSMRGAAFFWDMAELTGRDDYHETALGIARYLCRTFPWTNARQGAAVRDLMYLFRVTGEEVYRTAAQKIIATIARAQRADGSWFEYWDERGEAAVYDPPGHHCGAWTPRSCVKPEMASYNINGILDAFRVCKQEDLPDAGEVVRKAADWMAGAQSSEGAWRFPQFDSRGLYGYGLFQDAAGMLKAAQFFKDIRHHKAGMRAIEFGMKMLAKDNRIPAVIGVHDLDQTESSFTYFYALEALALMEASSEF